MHKPLGFKTNIMRQTVQNSCFAQFVASSDQNSVNTNLEFLRFQKNILLFQLSKSDRETINIHTNINLYVIL